MPRVTLTRDFFDCFVGQARLGLAGSASIEVVPFCFLRFDYSPRIRSFFYSNLLGLRAQEFRQTQGDCTSDTSGFPAVSDHLTISSNTGRGKYGGSVAVCG